ncbi:TrkH family potassium uptake protein [Anaerococcus sp. mt242]|uniref:TrkH family potassium uptake protein n=1 Tax=Anaerococcus sp. mt242 TaxID=2661917 RepID=UPI0019324F9B|nr:TrkH family potassium uptake protein [Anaerococcus sp. mt242]MBM0045661.1 TrkH family potassium uptake protein [Anaerococcus sp. mt242]
MNLKIINNAIGRLLQVLAVLMVLPLIVAFIYKEPTNEKINFIIPIIISGLAGTILVKLGSEQGHIFTKEAMFTTAFCWVLYSLIGAIPLYLTPSNYPSFIDAFFEMASGFTTCGASVALDVELLPHSIIFWRSFSHLIGGMGILVFTLAVLPMANKESTNLMQAEVPGPTFGKVTPKLSHTARVLYIIYLVMTAITVIFLLFGGMNLFDSIIYAFGAAGTGGFANSGISVGYYDSRYIEIVLGIAIFLFGINFNLYYYAIFRSVKDSFKSEELKWYAIIVAISSILIFINISGMYDDKFYAGVNSFFTVSSIITTTGYVSAHYGKWPMFSRNILILLMFVGGSAGSTAGGLKVSRITMLCKSAINQVKQTINPMRVTVNKLDGKKVDDEVENSVNKYLLVYLLVFIIFMLIVTLETNDLETSFTAVATTYNNVGPGLGEFGPINSFVNLGYLSKFTLTLAMLFGRLELYPMILLFSPATYKNMKNK